MRGSLDRRCRKDAGIPAAAPNQSHRDSKRRLHRGGALAPDLPSRRFHILSSGAGRAARARPREAAPRFAWRFGIVEAGRAAVAARRARRQHRVQLGETRTCHRTVITSAPAFAFVRLEAPAVFDRRRIARREPLSLVPVTEADLDEAKKSLAREVGMRSASACSAMRSDVGFAPRAALGAPFPRPRSSCRPPLDQLQSLRGASLRRRNIVATLVSPRRPPRGAETLRKLFGGVPPGPRSNVRFFPDSARAASIEKANTQGDRLPGRRAGSPGARRPPGVASFLVAGRGSLEAHAARAERKARARVFDRMRRHAPLPGGAVILAYLGTGAARLEEACRARAGGPRTRRAPLTRRRSRSRRIACSAGGSEASFRASTRRMRLGFDLLLCGRLSFQPMNGLISAATGAEVKGAGEAILSWDRAVVLRLVPESAAGEITLLKYPIFVVDAFFC